MQKQQFETDAEDNRILLVDHEMHIRIDERGVVVAIMMSKPFHAVGESLLIAPLWNDVEKVVGHDKHIESPRER